MGGLAHHFERAGIATTQISLVRLHTEKIEPPRALWVPFLLGRPFGPPNDSTFQKRVLVQALQLLEVDNGPILEDFPDDEPPTAGEQSGWACPIQYEKPNETLSGSAAVEAALMKEIGQFSSWYDLAVQKRGRTTVGASGLSVEQIAKFLAQLSATDGCASPIAELPLADAVRLCAEDLKAYYLEATSAQPGEASALQLNDWFWHDTVASSVLRGLKEKFLVSGDQSLQILAKVLLVPARVATRNDALPGNIR